MVWMSSGGILEKSGGSAYIHRERGGRDVRGMSVRMGDYGEEGAII